MDESSADGNGVEVVRLAFHAGGGQLAATRVMSGALAGTVDERKIPGCDHAAHSLGGGHRGLRLRRELARLAPAGKLGGSRGFRFDWPTRGSGRLGVADSLRNYRLSFRWLMQPGAAFAGHDLRVTDRLWPVGTRGDSECWSLNSGSGLRQERFPFSATSIGCPRGRERAG